MEATKGNQQEGEMLELSNLPNDLAEKGYGIIRENMANSNHLSQQGMLIRLSFNSKEHPPQKDKSPQKKKNNAKPLGFLNHKKLNAKIALSLRH